ncbi:hypothetical protein MXB_114 [Myxobolus squamalis]|nr:hypothetical protein MXB_114 [Myxobolus squamalis]
MSVNNAQIKSFLYEIELENQLRSTKKEFELKDKIINDLKIKSELIIEEIYILENEKMESENILSNKSDISTRNMQVHFDCPSSISFDIDNTAFKKSEIVVEQDFSNLNEREKDFEYKEMSFELFDSEKNIESVVKIFENEAFSTPVAPILEKYKTIDSSMKLLEYAPYSDFLTLSNLNWKKRICLSDSKIDNLKPLCDILLQNLKFNQWGKSVQICWLKNFLLVPPEIIPESVEVLNCVNFDLV